MRKDNSYESIVFPTSLHTPPDVLSFEVPEGFLGWAGDMQSYSELKQPESRPHCSKPATNPTAGFVQGSKVPKCRVGRDSQLVVVVMVLGRCLIFGYLDADRVR